MKLRFKIPISYLAGQLVCLLFLLLPGQRAFAQLVADFSVDQEAGCAPLTVSFNNKTAGASAGARFFWDFGNGNTSALHSPGATYRTEKTFTITLTVTDGGATATKSATVTVYKKPVVDFWTEAKGGCLPLAVPFSSSVQSGDGAITGYTWDFGNGNVVQGPNEQNPVHIFNFAQKPAVSLTVTNSYGCFTTVEKTALLEVQPQVKAGFTLNKSALCAIGDSVQFTNTSFGAGSLSYEWSFGDGSISNKAAPAHQYTAAGGYDVKLKVTTGGGCADSVLMPALVNVANFSNSIQAPAVVCTGAPMGFKAIHYPVPDSMRWSFGPGVQVPGTESVTPVFGSSGTRNIRLTSFWGGCSAVATAQAEVHHTPVLRGFVQDVAPSCRLPYEFEVHDTTRAAAAWQWEVPGQPLQNGQEATLRFAGYGQYPVTLTVVNAAGCAASLSKNILIVKPEVAVKVVRTSSRFGTADCAGLRIKFAAQSNVTLTSYRWDFGDGGTSSAASPEYVFSKPGRYDVVLTYRSATGCTDTAVYQEVAVYTKPNIDFSGPTAICSSNPVGFVAISDTAVRQYYWNYGDNTGFDTTTTIGDYNEHKYMREGVYTLTLVANGGGACADTVTKINYLKVDPPFQAIQNVFQDCMADRNRIFLHLNTRGVVSGRWDFGDGSAEDDVPADFQIVPHRFALPGVYNVKHTSVNGACTAADSVFVAVPGKQTPLLTASKNFVCLEDTVTLTISGVQLLDLSNYKNNPVQYSLSRLRYVDGTPFRGNIRVLDSNWATGYKVAVSSFGPMSQGLRAFIHSPLSGCEDSTDVLQMTFSGPTAGIRTGAPACFTSEVVLQDASAGNIRTWQWQVGGTALPARQAPDDIQWRFERPGVYPASLTVTDADGCYHTAAVPGGIRVLGVKAGFLLPDTVAAINTRVQFANTSEAIAGAVVRYHWTYDAGRRTATATHLTHSYPNIGWDTIVLVAASQEGNCTDTAVQVLHHDNINAKFAYTATYINNNSCPPLLVKFTNLSRNTRATRWTFGDGSSAQKQSNPERTYRQGGTYKVTLYTYGPNNIIDSASEYITVKGPSAVISADKQFGCLRQEVALKANVAYAKDYYWDFGDGAVLRARDTVARHTYLTAGIYTPSLVMSDSTGCLVAAELLQPVIIDSLSLAIGGIPPLICDEGVVTFQPKVSSIAVDRLNQPLAYQWRFGTAGSTLASPARFYTGEGQYSVAVTAVSPYGCVQTAQDTVVVRRTVKGSITGSAEICVEKEIRFEATIPGTGSTWQWLMPGGGTGTDLQSPGVVLPDSGFYPVRLVVSHDGCTDTARQTLWVHPVPTIFFENTAAYICRGTATTLQASGGKSYAWTGTEPILLGAKMNKPVVFPQKTAWYGVRATSQFGCHSTDSVLVRVIQPFKMAAIPDTFVCRGLSVTLQASGAYTYLWSSPDGSLPGATNAVLTAKPGGNTTYRVIGTDSARCFSDTVFARVRIEERPSVQAGPDQIVLTGSDVTLAARTSADVVSYQWLPKEAVQCSTCAQTTTAPRTPQTYALTVTNSFGCTATDSISISLQCTESRVHIPNAFTPDRNGLNETFSVRGRGATIKSFRIYDRWGALMFQTANVQLNDPKGAWDGSYKGGRAAPGTYAYMVELVCDTGEPFVEKGTVTLVR